MSFITPMAFLWGLLAVPVVVFYILKVRQRRIPVPTLMFWEQIFEEKKPRTLFQKLRHWLSLLAQLVLLLLIVLALADPLLPWQLFEAKRIVLIVDHSASMNATDVAPTRLDEAKRQAKRVVDGMRFFDTMAVVAAGSEAKVVSGLTGHRRTLLEAIDSIKPTDTPTRLDEATKLAGWLLAEEKHGQVVVVSDGAAEKTAELAADARTTFIQVAGEGENAAITRLGVRRSLVDPLGYDILAEVRNFSDTPLDCRFELYLNEEVLDVVPLKMDAGGTWSQVFSKASAEGGRLVAKLNHTDALAADNTAWAVIPKRDPIPVTLVTKGNVFLQKVFESIPLVRLTLTDKPPEKIAPHELVVFHSQPPATIPAGNVLVIDPQTASDLWEVVGPFDSALVTEQDKTSPLMAHVRLDNVQMPQAHRLKPLGEAHVLARALGGEPLYFSVTRPEGKTLVLTVNLDKGDLPLRTAFPIMMTNAMNWFTNTGGEANPSAASGGTVNVVLPQASATSNAQPSTANGESWKLISPQGEEHAIVVNKEEATLGPLDRCGIWTVRRGEQKIEIPCNLADAAESNIKPAATITDDDSAVMAGLGGKPLWFYLLAAACGLLTLEWFLYQRRWIS